VTEASNQKNGWPAFSRVLILVTILIGLLAACGPAGETSDEDTPTPLTPDEPIAAAGSETTTFDLYGGAESDDYTTTASGLQYVISEEGDGAAPEEGEVVTVHYTGFLTDGTKFDSSVDNDQPIAFLLGFGRVIPGWDEGIALMHVGDKGRLIIPPNLAYGSQGAGGVIPPDATLVFDVELISVHPAAPANPPDFDAEDLTITESGLQFLVLSDGNGASPEVGDQVVIEYTGWLEEGGKFDSSLDNGRPLVFGIGINQVIPGMDEGVSGMQVGERRLLVIPAALAYGDAGAGGGIIPPNATLIFEVELLEIS
jgi:peptidylprolyl isomerase